MSAQLEDIARLLEQSPDFRVLRRLQPRDVFSQSHCEQPLVGIVLDTETTGLDLDKAEVIELAMLKFHYTPDGEVLRVIGRFDELRQPANPIPPEITALTGITDEMVAGRSIDPAAVEAFVADAAIVIAHNARFDRPIAEKALARLQEPRLGVQSGRDSLARKRLRGDQARLSADGRRPVRRRSSRERRLPGVASHSVLAFRRRGQAGAGDASRQRPRNDDPHLRRRFAL